MRNLPPRAADRTWRAPDAHYNFLIIMVKSANCGRIEWRQGGAGEGLAYGLHCSRQQAVSSASAA
jgi:hypothetical protein